MQLIQGLGQIIQNYDVLLLDMWGVLHDGSRPYDGVLDCLRHLQTHHADKRLVILSNSSKRQTDSIRALQKLGFDPNAFSHVITSGEVAHQVLSADKMDWTTTRQSDTTTSKATKTVFCLGSGEGDVEYCQSCGYTLAPMDQADMILARGTFTINNGHDVVDKRHDATHYEHVLQSTLDHAAKRRLPMLISNPDKVRPDKDRPPMPGHLGDLYEAALQRLHDSSMAESPVQRIGKPFSLVYDMALADETMDRSRVLMVGDALETDVTGGSAAGIDTLWVLENGIHAPDLVSSEESLEEGAARILNEFNQKTDTYAKGRTLAPTYIIPSFRW